MNVLKNKQMNHTLVWAMMGLIIFGILAITFIVLSMIELGAIMVVGTALSFITIIMQGVPKSIKRKTVGGN